MKKLLTIACLALSLIAATSVPLSAQTAEASAATATPSQPRYGLIHYDSLLHAMPEYAEAEAQYNALRERYAKETDYNEKDFKRQFTEYLQGQKDFPQNILLKRQRDLQEAMEKSLAFRHEADSLLAAARADLEAPVRQLLDEAIRLVGAERGYDCVVNRDLTVPVLPYLNPALTEDATSHVVTKLAVLRRKG